MYSCECLNWKSKGVGEKIQSIAHKKGEQVYNGHIPWPNSDVSQAMRLYKHADYIARPINQLQE